MFAAGFGPVDLYNRKNLHGKLSTASYIPFFFLYAVNFSTNYLSITRFSIEHISEKRTHLTLTR